jgi:hypothetical protein
VASAGAVKTIIGPVVTQSEVKWSREQFRVTKDSLRFTLAQQRFTPEQWRIILELWGLPWSHGVPPGNCGGSSWSKLCSSWIYRFTSLGHRVSILSMGGPPRSSQSSPVEQWRFTMDNGDNSLALWRLVMEPWNASKVCGIHPEAYPESVEAHHGANLWRLTQKMWRLQFLYFEVIFEL